MFFGWENLNFKPKQHIRPKPALLEFRFQTAVLFIKIVVNLNSSYAESDEATDTWIIRPVVLSKQQLKFWKTIWNIPDTAPWIKIFLWKAIHNALPVGLTLHRRIPAILPNCKLCNFHSEDVSHASYHCPHARATWLISESGIQSHTLYSMQFAETIALANLESLVQCNPQR